jgi:hypothetical protein
MGEDEVVADVEETEEDEIDPGIAAVELQTPISKEEDEAVEPLVENEKEAE